MARGWRGKAEQNRPVAGPLHRRGRRRGSRHGEKQDVNDDGLPVWDAMGFRSSSRRDGNFSEKSVFSGAVMVPSVEILIVVGQAFYCP